MQNLENDGPNAEKCTVHAINGRPSFSVPTNSASWPYVPPMTIRLPVPEYSILLQQIMEEFSTKNNRLGLYIN